MVKVNWKLVFQLVKCGKFYREVVLVKQITGAIICKWCIYIYISCKDILGLNNFGKIIWNLMMWRIFIDS